MPALLPCNTDPCGKSCRLLNSCKRFVNKGVVCLIPGVFPVDRISAGYKSLFYSATKRQHFGVNLNRTTLGIHMTRINCSFKREISTRFIVADVCSCLFIMGNVLYNKNQNRLAFEFKGMTTDLNRDRVSLFSDKNREKSTLATVLYPVCILFEREPFFGGEQCRSA